MMLNGASGRRPARKAAPPGLAAKRSGAEPQHRHLLRADCRAQIAAPAASATIAAGRQSASRPASRFGPQRHRQRHRAGAGGNRAEVGQRRLGPGRRPAAPPDRPARRPPRQPRRAAQIRAATSPQPGHAPSSEHQRRVVRARRAACGQRPGADRIGAPAASAQASAIRMMFCAADRDLAGGGILDLVQRLDPGAGAMRADRAQRHRQPDRVADLHRADEAHPLVAVVQPLAALRMR